MAVRSATSISPASPSDRGAAAGYHPSNDGDRPGPPAPTLWRRPPGQLYVDGVDLDDCEQGALGDCWLVSTLSVIAGIQHGRFIQDAITDNKDGTFTVKLYRERRIPGLFGTDLFGSKKLERFEVTVGPEFPTSFNLKAAPGLANTPGGFVYAHGSDPRELWPVVMEAAVAKAWGGYAELQSRNRRDTAEVLLMITGRKGDWITTDNTTSNAAWHWMNRRLNRGEALIASTGDENGSTGKKGKVPLYPAIVSHHAYAVLDTAVVNGQRFVKLRNPWRALDQDGKDTASHGQFWVAYDVFRKYFEGVVGTDD